MDNDFSRLAEGCGIRVCAAGERLPFCVGAFDTVESNVALPYMHIPATLQEVARVLRVGGQVRFSLHPASQALRDLFRAMRSGSLVNTVYRLYVLANGILFHFTGRMIRYPLKRRRIESFQTRKGMERALEESGFQVTNWQRGKNFVVHADLWCHKVPPRY